MGTAVTIASLVTTGRAASAQLGVRGVILQWTPLHAVVIGGTPMSGGVANVAGNINWVSANAGNFKRIKPSRCEFKLA